MNQTFKFLTIAMGLLLPLGSFAQTIIRVETGEAVCKVALISDKDAASGEYGWWSIWQEMNSTEAVDYAPVEFEAYPGTYTLVVYWENNNDQSDGIALEKIQIGPYITDINYSFHTSDFTEWNCLSCPWLCLFNGTEYVKHSEVLKDVTGYENRTTTSTLLDPASVIDGKVRFRIQEEKDEISYLDQIRLKVGDEYLEASSEQADKLSATDDNFVVLKKGEHIDLEVAVPDGWDASIPMQLEVTGYYHPEAEFMASITRKLLKQDH